MRNDIEHVVERLKSGEASPLEIQQLMHHRSILVRANALEAASRLAVANEFLVDDLISAAADPTNAAVLLGSISVSQVAVAALLRAGLPRAADAARDLIARTPEPQRSDLVWYLESEKLLAR